MIEVPKVIQKYLVMDEVVQEEFPLHDGWKAYATTRRLFLRKRNTVMDIDYAHISSIEFKRERDLLFLVPLGFVCGLVGYFLRESHAFYPLLMGLGIFLVALGILSKSDRVRLAVVGLGSRTLKGEGATLDALFRFVRERRV